MGDELSWLLKEGTQAYFTHASHASHASHDSHTSHTISLASP